MKLSDQLSLPLECGGKGRCGKCKVYASGALSPLTPEELSLLTQEEVQAGCRLACMTEILGEYTASPYRREADDLSMAVQLSFRRPLSPAAGRGPDAGIGAAVDIGTTTLAAYWYDLSTGQLLAQKAAPNPQRIFGADVMTRIERAMQGQLPQLSAALRQAILSLLPPAWDRLVLAGNTTMLYLLCGYPPDSLSAAPFQADHTFGFQKDRVILPSCFSAFVGADIAAAALAAGLWENGRVAPQKPALLLDAGTNAEMLLAAGGRLYGCAAAAGPAFEGSHLSCGLPSVPGAICHVYLSPSGDFQCETIGADSSASPKGYCGSGVLDLLSALLQSGSLDRTGLLLSPWPASNLPALTQQDVREIQLAKSAIAAGCETLMKAAGVDELDTIYLAGGFGSQLNSGSARRIGLIPPARHILPIGNGAGCGAAMLLLNPALLEETRLMRQCFELVELANDAYFSEAFMRHMYFPEV